MHEAQGTDRSTPILEPGETCWRIERADRFAVIVDAADYFSAIKHAINEARHSVMLIGWDFDTRIQLDPLGPETEAPDQLGRFLNWIVRNRPDLHIHVLRWNLAAVRTLGRGQTPFVLFGWMTHRHVHVKLDHAHPAAAAHHQKIVVIDDALAFCGGIDMTADRWDTRAHADDDPHRHRPTTRRSYGPWHDVSTAVSGPAAKALGDLARDRWHRATGERLEPPPSAEPAWPKGLPPLTSGVDVAIARTMPEHDGNQAIHEIEKLYLAAIAAAKRVLYIESQYFASRTIAEAMAERLREPDGPEIVVVNPESADGWLEEEVMGSARARLLRLIARADTHDRFRIYTPVTEGREPIYVHAKVLIMDDRLLRVGSSNLNNRSMGFDTECDLALEALSEDDGGLRRHILALRNDLLAEHLGVELATVEATLDRTNGSLIATIEDLQSDARSLVQFEPPEFNAFEEEALAENELLDPERPKSRRRALNLSRWLPWR